MEEAGPSEGLKECFSRVPLSMGPKEAPGPDGGWVVAPWRGGSREVGLKNNRLQGRYIHYWGGGCPKTKQPSFLLPLPHRGQGCILPPGHCWRSSRWSQKLALQEDFSLGSAHLVVPPSP